MDMRKWDLFKTGTKNIAGNAASIYSVFGRSGVDS